MKHCLVFASLISPSKMILFEKKYQTFDTVFHHQMKFIVIYRYDLARAKSEALDNIYSLFKQNIKSRNAKRRRQRRRTVKNSNRSYQQKNNFARAAHFFVHFFAVVLHDYIVKPPETFFYGGNVVCVPVRFFSHCIHFHLDGRQHFSFSHRRYKLFMFSSNTLAPSLLSTSMQTLKFIRKSDSGLLFFFL